MNENSKSKKKIRPALYTLYPKRYTLKQGVTLVELLTGFAIVGVIGIMIGTVYLAHFRLFSTQSTSIDIKTQNTLAMDDITNELKQARYVRACTFGISYPPPAGTLFVCTPGGGSLNNTQITIWLWPLDSSGKAYTQETLNSTYCPCTVFGNLDNNFDAVDVINYKINGNQIEKKILTFDENPNFTPISSRNKNFSTTNCGYYDSPCKTSKLAGNAQELKFTYYKKDGTSTTTPSATDYQLINSVKIDITTQLNTTPPKPSPNKVTQSEKVNFINFEF